MNAVDSVEIRSEMEKMSSFPELGKRHSLSREGRMSDVSLDSDFVWMRRGFCV